MQVQTRLLVLSALKYGDSSLIVKGFTESDGLKGYLVKGALSSRKGKLKAAYFQPMTLLEVVAYHRNKGSLEHLKEVRLDYPTQSLHLRMDKKAISIFLSEVLSSSLREEEQNIPLFQFLHLAVQVLDQAEQVANFHLWFLLELSRFLGFYPHGYQEDLPYFDLVEGVFLAEPSHNLMITGEEVAHFKTLLGIDFEAIQQLKLNNTNRRELLHYLLRYFEIHLHGFRKPKSLAIFHEIFH